MKVLVTGGTGFVGSHIVDRLLLEGHEVTAAIRPTSNLRWLNPAAKTVIAPMTDLKPLEAILPEIDAVVHCAGVVRARLSAEFFAINRDATIELAKLCIQFAKNLKSFVFISSQAAGRPGRDCDCVCESTPEMPISSYGKSKLEAERALEALGANFPIVALRPPTVYGPRDSEVFFFFKLISCGVMFYPGSPQRQFSIVYVEDLARAAVLSLKIDGDFSRFFIDDGEVHTWRAFAEAISRAIPKSIVSIRLPVAAFYPASAVAAVTSALTGKTPMLTFEKSRELSQNWVCDGSLFRKTTGFTPEFDMRRGIEETLDWYRDNRWL